MDIVKLALLSSLQAAVLGLVEPAQAQFITNNTKCIENDPCLELEQVGWGVGLRVITGFQTPMAAVEVDSYYGPGAIIESSEGDGLIVKSTKADGAEIFTSGAGKSAIYAHHDGTDRGNAIWATTPLGIGIYARSSNGDGVEASAAVSNASALYAHNDASSGGNGVYAKARGTGRALWALNTASNGWAGYFEGKVFMSAGYTMSDGRHKKDIRPLRHGLADVERLRPVSYRWKGKPDDSLQLGLIAQEVQAILPELVDSDRTTGTLSVNYTALLPVAIRAIQEQQALIQAQEARIVRLERQQQPLLSAGSMAGGLGGAALLSLLPFALVARYRKRPRLA